MPPYESDPSKRTGFAVLAPNNPVGKVLHHFDTMYKKMQKHPGQGYSFFTNSFTSGVARVVATSPGAVTVTPALNKQGEEMPEYTAVFIRNRKFWP